MVKQIFRRFWGQYLVPGTQKSITHDYTRCEEDLALLMDRTPKLSTFTHDNRDDDCSPSNLKWEGADHWNLYVTSHHQSKILKKRRMICAFFRKMIITWKNACSCRLWFMGMNEKLQLVLLTSIMMFSLGRWQSRSKKKRSQSRRTQCLRIASSIVNKIWKGKSALEF